MPRNISFMLTKKQFANQTKTVTRRLGWRFLKLGDILNGCEKCQGLRKGEKIKKLGQIRVVRLNQEFLQSITPLEVVLEGFPQMTPDEFIDFFCQSHRGCTPETVVTRIEFEHLTNERNGTDYEN